MRQFFSDCWAIAALAPFVCVGALPLRPDSLDIRKQASNELSPAPNRTGTGASLQQLLVNLNHTNGTLMAEFNNLVHENAGAVDDAAKLIRVNAHIVGGAVSQAILLGGAKLKRGDVSGAIQAVDESIVEARQKAAEANRSFRSAAWSAACVLMLFVGVGACWGIEHLLTLRGEKDPNVGVPRTEQDQDQYHHFPALGVLRFVLSGMVLLYNFYPWSTQEVKSRRADTLSTLSSWGLLAAPMFFTLSGFCQSYSKLTGPKAALEEDMLSAMVARIMAWYPSYVITLIFLCVVFFSYSAWDWTSFMAHVFLISGSFQEHREAVFPYLPCSWWFTCLAAYTLAWLPMHNILKLSSDSVIWTMFVMATAVVVPSVLLQWLFFKDMAIFEMIQYSFAFFYGQALAVWQVNHCMLLQVQTAAPSRQLRILQPVAEMPFSVRFGVTGSVLALGFVMIFISPFDEVPLFREPCYPIFTKGLLSPFTGLLILGLCNEADPLARLAARGSLHWVGKLSLSMYLLALPVHIVVESVSGFPGLSWTFLGSLLAASVVGHFLIEIPSRKFADILARTLAQRDHK
mmetsp:Transcript_54052/g.126891  ORF Transcript_54052/g.126891 Transcript_54052/m.126891 type:complete len:572 (-) Transcript_54052:94-1809(-)